MSDSEKEDDEGVVLMEFIGSILPLDVEISHARLVSDRSSEVG